MKLSVKLAGLCGSGMFILTALPGVFQQLKPVSFIQINADVISSVSIFETLLLSLAGAVAAGGMGYAMGTILSNPHGSGAAHTKGKGPGHKPQESKEKDSSVAKETVAVIPPAVEASVSPVAGNAPTMGEDAAVAGASMPVTELPDVGRDALDAASEEAAPMNS